MALMVNGSRVEFAGYEFGLEVDGIVSKTGTYDEMTARRNIDAIRRSRVVFRARYQTSWVWAEKIKERHART